MPFGIQPIHIVIIVIVAFLLFGTSKMPDMGRSLGKTINEFRKGMKDAAEGFKEEVSTGGTADHTPPNSSADPAATQSGKGNYCIQCGASNPPEARFCSACGTKLPEKGNAPVA
jgi:sec-independent protein translocase protein TatA